MTIACFKPVKYRENVAYEWSTRRSSDGGRRQGAFAWAPLRRFLRRPLSPSLVGHDARIRRESVNRLAAPSSSAVVRFHSWTLRLLRRFLFSNDQPAGGHRSRVSW